MKRYSSRVKHLFKLIKKTNFFATYNKLFSTFSGGTNPGFDLLDDHDDPFAFAGLGTGLGANLGFGSRTPFRSHSFNIGSQNRAKEKPQDPPIEHDLYVTLEDLFKVILVSSLFSSQSYNQMKIVIRNYGATDNLSLVWLQSRE